MACKPWKERGGIWQFLEKAICFIVVLLINILTCVNLPIMRLMQPMTRSNSPIPPLRRTVRSLPIALLRARETVMGPVRDMLAGSPVNEQKWRVLRVLEEGGPQDQNTIARAASLLLPSLTRILRVMEDDGMISRADDPGDRRRSIVRIKEPGRAILESYGPQAAALVDRLRADFGEEKLEQLLDLLEELQALDLSR